jgi:hypothetical protein
VLRLQGSVFRSEAGLVCHSPPKTIVTIYLTEDRESRPHQVVFRAKVYRQVHIDPSLVDFCLRPIVHRHICFLSYNHSRHSLCIFQFQRPPC